MAKEPQSLSFPACPAPFNIAAHVLKEAERLADKVALVVLKPSGAQRWSYAKLRSAILGTATGLLRSGLTPGDRVLLRLGNTVEFPIAFLGAITAGLVPIPTSAQLTDPEITSILKNVQPRLILRTAGVACPDCGIPMIDGAGLTKMRSLPPATFDMGDPNRLAFIIFTSGTSGQARAVAHAHRSIWARGMMMEGWYGLRETDRLMHAGAFNWSFTLGTGLMDPWTMGATALVPAAGTSPAQLPLLIKRHDATIFAAVPGVYRQMLAAGPMPDMPHLRHGLVAGEKLSDALRANWRDQTGCDLHEAFGMSECSTFVSGSPSSPALAGTLGRPQPGRRIAIVGEDGPLPHRSQGILAVHKDDPGLMLKYLNAPQDTEARFAGDWFLTGDLGQMDDAGNITYLGRADDMMNAGGYRVSPLEVETVLNDHPDIVQTAVTDIEVKQDTRVIMAFYTAPAPLSEPDLADFVSERLARYKQPRGFVHVKSLPTSANGKLLRRALQPIYEDLHGQS
ncbi:MAG: class I adenylate-forming enzyme family protein [Pseudomonadota bacterium]